MTSWRLWLEDKALGAGIAPPPIRRVLKKPRILTMSIRIGFAQTPDTAAMADQTRSFLDGRLHAAMEVPRMVAVYVQFAGLLSGACG